MQMPLPNANDIDTLYLVKPYNFVHVISISSLPHPAPLTIQAFQLVPNSRYRFLILGSGVPKNRDLYLKLGSGDPETRYGFQRKNGLF